MRYNLIWGIVDILLALVMVLCIIVNCVNANWIALPICIFAMSMNINCAISHFREYVEMKKWTKAMNQLDKTIEECWPNGNDVIISN